MSDQRAPIKNLVSRHTLGLRGHLTTPKEFLRTAEQHNIRITQSGHEKHRYSIETLNGDFDKLCPPYIKEKANEQGLFDRDTMLEFLHFCRQPINTSLKKLVGNDYGHNSELRDSWIERSGESTAIANMPIDMPDENAAGIGLAKAFIHSKAETARIMEERKAVHQLLRLVTTGSLVIPKKEGLAHLQQEHNECHEVAEEAMREAYNWEVQPEFGQSESIKVTVPGTAHNPRHGFIFHVNPGFRNGTLAGDSRAALRDFMLRILDEIKGQTPLDLQNGKIPLALDAGELQKLTERLHEFFKDDANLKLIAQARIEDLAERAVNSIGERKKRLEALDSFQRLARISSGDAETQFKNLLLCSSALTPVIAGRELEKAVNCYHVTSLTPSPAQGLVEEIAVFEEAIRQLQKKSTPSLADVEAFKHEFYPLLSFLREFSKTLDTARELALSKNFENLPPETQQALHIFGRNIDDMQASFAALGITDFCQNESMMDERYQSILRDVRRYIGETGGWSRKFHNAGQSFHRGAIMPLVSFFGDSLKFIGKNPVIVGIFSSVVAFNFYINNPDKPKIKAPEGMAAIQTVKPEALKQEEPGPDGFIDMGAPVITFVPKKDIPPPPPGYDPSYHWDLGLLGPYKHTVGGKVVEVSGYGVEGVRLICELPYTGLEQIPDHILKVESDDQSAFAKKSQATIRPTADLFLGVNILQNVSHAGFWTYTLLLGAIFGLRALRHLGMFFGPMSDLAKNGAMSPFRGIGSLVDIARRDPVKAKRLANLIDDLNKKGLDGLTPQDHMRNMRTISELINASTLNVEVANRRAQLSVTADSFSRAEMALNQIDILVREIADGAGISEGRYQEKLADHVGQLRKAFRNFAEQGSEVNLEQALGAHLQEVAGAELRHAGSSEFLDNLTVSQVSKPQTDRLLYKAAHLQGSTNRAEKRAERRRALTTLGRDAGPRLSLASKFKQLVILDPGQYAGARNPDDKQISLAQFCGKAATLGGSYMGEGFAKTFRFAQNGVSRMPYKTLVKFSTGGAIATCIEMDIAGVDTPIVDFVSGTVGQGTAFTITGATFMGYNYVEDALGVHVGMAAVDVVAGTIVGRVGYTKTARPIVLYTSEVIRNATDGKIDIADFTINLADHIGARLHYLKNEIWEDGISRPLARRAQLLLGAAAGPDDDAGAPVPA